MYEGMIVYIYIIKKLQNQCMSPDVRSQKFYIFYFENINNSQNLSKDPAILHIGSICYQS